MTSPFISIIPVLPSSDINRDIVWYQEKTGFDLLFSDEMYAVLFRDLLCIHLQWHANNPDDPLLGGSVIRILVDDITALFDEFVQRGTVAPDALKVHTAWNTDEFGFFDLNKNLIFIVKDLSSNPGV
jgi:hypothetical protein